MSLQPSLLNMGLGMGVLPGIIYDKFGPAVTSLVGLCASVGGYLLLWSTTLYIDFYQKSSALIGLYFMICGKFTSKKVYPKI